MLRASAHRRFIQPTNAHSNSSTVLQNRKNMKKKLSLKNLSVKSFVTEINTQQVKGGGGLDDTLYSCMAYISCNILQCVATVNGNGCA